MTALKKSKFSHSSVEILDKRTVFQDYFRVDKYRLRHQTYEGGWSEEFERELFERGSAAAALLYDPVRDQVVLQEQFRIGAISGNDAPWLIEIVAGVIEQSDADPSAVVIRESEEEAGMKVLDLWPIVDYWVSPGGSSERVALFCARVDARMAGGIYGIPEEHENIRAFVVDAAAAFQAVTQGIINNAPAIIALQWLQLNKDTVQNTWKD